MIHEKRDDKGEKCSYEDWGTGKVEFIHGDERHVG